MRGIVSMTRGRLPRTIDPSVTPVRRKPSLDFSITGLIYCSMMMFMGLAAINSQANLLFGVFGLMIGILLVSGIISRMMLRGMRVQREMPETAAVGHPVTLTYHFVNNKRFWPSVSICMSELDGAQGFVRQPQSYLMHAAGGSQAEVPTEVVPKRRGMVGFDRYQISTSFPFGFIKRAVERRTVDTVVIFPAIGRVDPRLVEMCLPAEKTGPTMRPRRGGMDEVYGLKEYRRGENPRWIYWKRSARTGVLVSKEMTQVAPPRLVLLVDTCISDPSPARREAVERVIAMAASLASHVLGQGVSVGVYAWSGDWKGIPPARGKRQRKDVLAFLALLPINTAHGPADLTERSAEIMESGSTAVLLTPQQSDRTLGDLSRSQILALSISDPQTLAWFTFDATVDFARCGPLDADPAVAKDDTVRAEAPVVETAAA